MLLNLKSAIDLKFATQSEAAEALFPDKSAKNSNLSTLLSSDPNKKFRRPTVEAIKRVFPEYSVEWLLNNKGQRFAVDQYNEKLSEQTSYSSFQEHKSNYGIQKLEAIPLRLADPEGLEATGERFYELPDQTIIMQTPVIPVKSYNSYLRGHADPEFYEGLETLPIPVDIRHKGTYLIFETKGDSMVNITDFEMARKSIWPGQKIIGREVKKDHWKYKLHINSNECWVIVHRERGIVTKSIIDHDVDRGILTLHSWNPDKDEHPDYKVFLDDVDQIFNVVDPYGKIK